MRVPAAAAAALALATATALAGCGGSHPHRPANGSDGGKGSGGGAAAGRPAGDADLLRALLARRAKALQSGDARALAATSTPGRRSADRRAARRAAALGLGEVGLEATALNVTGRRATLAVQVSYSLAGVPGRFPARERLRAQRTAHGWRVSALITGRDRPPWDVAPFTVRRNRHFAVLAPPGVRGSDVAAVFEAARARLAGALPGVPAPPRLAVLVAADVAQARSLTASIGGVEGLAAIADAAVRESGPAERVTQIVSRRLVVVWTAYESLDAASRARVATHELTHAALAGRTSGRTPGWLVEGVALFASGDRRAIAAGRLLRGDALVGVSAAAERAARRVMSLAALARTEALARLGGLQREAAYAYASAAAFEIARAHGRPALLRLYDAFDDPRLRGPPGRALEATAIRRALRTPLAALERAVRAYAISQAGPAPATG